MRMWVFCEVFECTLKMEATQCLDMSGTIHPVTQHRIPKDLNHCWHYSKNLGPDKYDEVWVSDHSLYHSRLQYSLKHESDMPGLWNYSLWTVSSSCSHFFLSSGSWLNSNYSKESCSVRICHQILFCLFCWYVTITLIFCTCKPSDLICHRIWQWLIFSNVPIYKVRILYFVDRTASRRNSG
jgi:hypothetical protein